MDMHVTETELKILIYISLMNSCVSDSLTTSQNVVKLNGFMRMRLQDGHYWLVLGF